MNRKSKPAALFIMLFGLAMLVGLPWYIYSVLDKHSRSAGQSDALIFPLERTPILATVVKDFKASSVGSGGGGTAVSGHNEYYARAIDMEDGNVLWNVKLDAKNDKGQDWGDAVLLGQSDNYLFYLRNELYVINKKDGKIVARNEDLKHLQGKLMKESCIFPTIVPNYAYDDSLQTIFIKGSDGLAYQLDINALKSSPAPQVNVSEYFFKKQITFRKKAVQGYDEQLVTLTKVNGWQFAFMDSNDHLLLQKGEKPPYGHTAAPRRFLYKSTASAPLSAMLPGFEVYLKGGFLRDFREYHNIYPKEQSDFYSGPYQLLSRGTEDTQAPIYTFSEGYLILHRASVASNAPILFTAVNTNGNEQWTFTSTFTNISKVLRTGDQILILGNSGDYAEGEVSDILCLSQRKVKTYNFKKGQLHEEAVKMF